MDNNPFRSSNAPPSAGQFNGVNNNSGYMSPATYGQQQPQQQQNFGYSTPTGYSQPQPQQSWQNNMIGTGPNTPYSPIISTQPLSNTTPNTTTSYQPYNQQPYNQQSFNQQQPYNQQQQSFGTTPYQSQPQLQQQQQTYSPYGGNTNTSSLMSSPTVNSMGGGFQGNTYQPTSMPTPDSYQQSMYGGNNMGMQQQQPQYNNSNFYIPPNFGQSNTPTTNNNNNMYQPQQPRHAPVDASTLLKGTQVRRVECPVCQKMIEGDDMAVNHHVNEHYS